MYVCDGCHDVVGREIAVDEAAALIIYWAVIPEDLATVLPTSRSGSTTTTN